MANRSEIIKGSFWSYLGQATALAISLATSIILARLLDKDNWGLFATLMAVVSFTSTIADLGLNYSIIHKASSSSNKSSGAIRRLLSVPLRYKLALILMLGALMFVFSNELAAFFNIADGGKYFAVSAAFFVVYNFTSMLDLVFIGLKKFRESSLLFVVHALFRITFSYILVTIGFGVNGAVLGYISAVAVLALLQIVIIRKYVSFTEDSGEDVVEMFTYGFYFGIGNLAAYIALWTDSIVIGALIGTTAVGIYRIGLSISSAVGGLTGIISKVLFPMFSSAESNNKESIGDLNTAIKYGSFIAFPAVIGLIISAESIILAFFGGQYIEGVLSLMILSYVPFDMMFTGIISAYLAAKKHTKVVGYTAILASIANFVMNLMLIPVVGIAGAALASVLTRIGNAAYLIHWLQKNVKVNVDVGAMSLPLIGSVLMGLLLFVAKPLIDPTYSVIHLIIFVVFGMASYAIIEQLLGFDVVSFTRKIGKVVLPPSIARRL